jgi:hypothetical protein
MKRPVSLVASLALVSLLAAGCGGVQAGKTELASICLDRYGNSQAKCDCYVETLEAALPPDMFQTVAQGAYDNRDYAAKDWLPISVKEQPQIAAVLSEATAACMAQTTIARR